MPVPVGTRLGRYEIQAAIGAGGMGEVYRGRDTTLNREVALKILPALFATDPDRLARFEREAQLLAALNHPHVAAIYGIEEAAGIRAIVLELVEGSTLADRIARGPIPLEDALPIARQITQALEAAHERGIVHRDLKPANVKLRPDGVVKVLDFGLAKALDPAPGSADASASPTVTGLSMTGAGVILGTAAYMSPEQAKGRLADKRSDVWAFGCVLFEMLTGRRAFEGEDVAETLASILTREPPFRLLPPGTPPSIHRVLRRCLEKDRARRLADVADVRLELDEPAPDASGVEMAALSPSRPGALRRWLPWSIAAASLAAAVCLAGLTAFNRPSHDAPLVRTSILLPGRLGGRWGGTTGANLAISPDGRRLAFVATDASGHRQLWVRTLDDTAARPLAGTDDALSPFWSPDSRWLAFVANGKLKRLDPSGGPAITLCESALAGGTWSRDDIILFTESVSQALAQVPAAGGTPTAATTLAPASGEFRHAHPSFLPDGRRFVYVAIGLSDQVAVYMTSLESAERIKLPVDAFYVQVTQSSLLYARRGTLMAQPFDEHRSSLVGTAVPIAEQVRVDPTPRGGYFSASDTGMLVFQEDLSPGFELVWFDREGRPTGTLGEPADYADLSLSPDGRHASVSIAEPGTANRDLWIFDVARGVRTRFTADPAPETHNVWSPDGSRIVFDSRRRGHRDLYVRASDGSGDEQVLLEDEFDKAPTSWSPDGRYVMYLRATRNRSMWVLPLDGDRRPFPFRKASDAFNELPSGFSPDGRWIASFSNDSGRWEVYVYPFPGPGGRTQLSTAGGFDARWRGGEIFYLSPDSKLMVAQVSTERGVFQVGEVKPLFELPKVGARFTYDVTADGRRILAVTRKTEGASAPLTLVSNWPALLQPDKNSLP